jgi:hypothetical protein
MLEPHLHEALHEGFYKVIVKPKFPMIITVNKNHNKYEIPPT